MNQLAALWRGGVLAARRSSGLLLLAAHLASLNARANVINWTNLNGGFWNAPTNWSPNTVPTPGDDVLIAAAGNYSVTQDVHITIASLTLGSSSGTQTLTNPGLSLTLNGASVVTTHGVLGLDGGTLGGAGVLSVDGKAVWTGGTIVGEFTIATNGVLNINGSATKSLSGTGTIVNYGSLAWSGPSDIQTANYARIINQPGALFDIQDNQSLAIANGGAITNLGTVRKSSGGGTTLITVPLFNFGTLDVQSGLVAYAGGSQFNPGTAFTGTGTNLVYTGTITFDGAILSENLEIAGATIAGNSLFSGVVNWTSGTLGSGAFTIAPNGVLNIKGSETKYLSGTGTLINYGSVAWSGTNDIQTGNSARIINQAGALFDIQNNQSLVIGNGGAITNLGTLRKSAGRATTLISVPLFNFGTLDVESGLVAYGGGSQFNPGTAFTGTGTNLVYTGTVTFNGAIPSENLEIAGAAFGGNSIFSGVVNWTGGTLPDDSAFTVASNGVLHISGSVDKDLAGTITNLGLVVWSGTNNLTTFRAARIINQPGALFDIRNNQSLSSWNGGAITNLGTLRKSVGGENTVIGLPLNNSGTVDVQSGTITFGNYKQTGGRLSFGLNSLTNFGRVAFASSVALTGTLGLNLNGGYIPVAGNTFALITYPSRSGAFTEFDLPATHAWQTNSSIYGATVLTLAVLNTRPTLSLIADRTMDEQVQLAFLITGSDPDPGQSLSYSLLNPPAGATVNTNTGYFKWTPDETQGPSTNRLSVQVTDNGAPSLTVTRVFTVVVNEVNLAPTLTVPPGQTVDELTTLTVTNFATDSDIPANTLSFSLVSAPPGVTLDPNSGVLTWTPDEAQGPSTSTIMVAVTDNGTPPLGVTNHFTVIVLESNLPPILAWIPDLTAIQNVLLLYTNCATDADLPANSLRFDLAAFPPGMTLDATNGVLRWTPDAGQVPSTNLVTVRVTDNGQPAKTDLKNFSVAAYPLPFLTIAKMQTNAVLSWPAYATGFTLQQAAEFNPPVFWADITNAVAVEGGMNRVTNRADAPCRCFRLHSGSGSSQP